MISFVWLGYVLALVAAGCAGKNLSSSSALMSSMDTASNDVATISSSSECGGTLTALRGIIQTPNFPNKFHVPIQCTWIIDASAIAKQNVSIVVYFTQQFVLSGLQFTEYAYYSDDFKVKSDHAVFELNDKTVTQVSWVRFYTQFLEIKFTMHDLYGTHLRALDRLLDVYGFNITYEIDEIVKPYQCNALLCRYLGHCYATANFTSYYCSCFPGFSGDDCGLGPLCHDGDEYFCENGGVCKQVGDAGVTCLCPKGFKGKKCQIPEDETMIGCFSDDKDCDSRCEYSGHDQDTCKCTQQTTSISNLERVRFEATVRLGNSSSFVAADTQSERRRSIQNAAALFQMHIAGLLRNLNVSEINDLQVYRTLNTNADITFHFYGAKRDSIRIRGAIQKMVERGRLGNISWNPVLFDFKQEAALQIMSVSVNYKTAVRQDAEFILSCEAQGSPKMIFRWYKNGIYVNTTKATRKLWSRLYEDSNLKDHYTALLGVPKASRLDEGVYTCQVSDYDMQQCRSVAVHIATKPELRLDPPSATVYRGESLRVRCLSSDSDQGYGTLGYSWTKNNALFQSDADAELWEDLYPDGSILKVYNIQKSANYTCVSANSVGQVSKSVYVYVVDREAVELCPNDSAFGVNWPSSSPGSPILAECPKRYEGQSQRICEQRDFGKPMWLTPNFANCVADNMVDVYNEFRGLTFGYEKTNGSTVLKSCLEYAMNRHSNFLPGEASFLLKLLQEVDDYLKEKGSDLEQEIAADIILQILDVVLKSEFSLNSQLQVKQLEALIQSANMKRDSLLSPVPRPAPSTSIHYHQTGSFYVHKEHIKTLPFSSKLNGDHLFTDQLYMEMALTPQLQEILTNHSMILSVISYKNLTNFLPRMYFERNLYESDMDYKTASRIIASWLVYANRTLNEVVVPTSQLLHLPMETAHVEIIFQHENPPSSEWMPVCGYDLEASHEATWRTDLCKTENIMDNVTRCICPLSGSYIVLLAKRNNPSMIRTTSRPIFVVVSCGCCFLQSCIAFGILLPILYSRKCSVTFLKMQFCTATSTAMAIFTLGFSKLLPEDWHGIISSSLGGILLLGTSTLIGIVLIIDSEVGPRKSSTAHLSSGMLRSAIGLSWFMPTLYAVTTPLVYTIVGNWPLYWWMPVNSVGGILFIIIETLFVIIFSLLFLQLTQKLTYLKNKQDKHSNAVSRRIELMYRTTGLLVLKLSTDVLHLVYLNTNEFIISYAFGASAIFLGFVLLICFVFKAETKMRPEEQQMTNPKHFIEDFCSASINSPLNCNLYTKHDMEKDSDSFEPTSQSSKELPLTIASRRYPLDRFQTNAIDAYAATGGLCETTYLKLNDPCVDLDANFIEFKHQQQPLQSLSSHPDQLLAQTSQLGPNTYEMDVIPSNMSLYGSSCKPTQRVHFLGDNNDFVAVTSLDILPDSVITTRNSSNSFDPAPKTEANVTNISTILPTTSKELFQSARDLASEPQTQTPSVPPTITITSSDDEKSIDGMLDRISHDLDYLLNRTTDMPTQI